MGCLLPYLYVPIIVKPQGPVMLELCTYWGCDIILPHPAHGAFDSAVCQTKITSYSNHSFKVHGNGQLSLNYFMCDNDTQIMMSYR